MIIPRLVATIQKARPELLGGVAGTTPIPEEIPQNYASQNTKRVAEVEGIGEPMTACFFTKMNIDPTGWYRVRARKVSYSFPVSGACLKSMTECGRFGILSQGRCTPGTGAFCHFLLTLSNQCRTIYSWMENSGTV